MNVTQLAWGCPRVDSGPTVIPSTPQKNLAIVMYSSVVILAVFGNGFVIFIVAKFDQMHTATNYFIVNLALSDIMLAVLCTPFSYWPVVVSGYWPFGPVLCTVTSFAKALSVLLSAHTLIIICLDRFRAVFKPLSAEISGRVTLILLGSLWIADCIQALPMGIFAKIVFHPGANNTTTAHCTEKFSSENGAEIYSYFMLLSQYFLPVTILITSYSAIGIKLHSSRIPGERGELIRKGRKKATRKVITMLLTISLMYTLCWLPQNLLNIFWSRCPNILEHPHIIYVWWTCHYLAMGQSCINPIIYIASSQRFREGFQYIFRWLPCVQFQPLELGRKNTYFTLNGTRNPDGTLKRGGVPEYSMRKTGAPKENMVPRKLSSNIECRPRDHRRTFVRRHTTLGNTQAVKMNEIEPVIEEVESQNTRL